MRLTFTQEQAAAILPDLRAAVSSMVAGWDAQRRIEIILGHDFKDMEENGISNMAVGMDYDSQISVEHALEYINNLEVDGE